MGSHDDPYFDEHVAQRAVQQMEQWRQTMLARAAADASITPGGDTTMQDDLHALQPCRITLQKKKSPSLRVAAGSRLRCVAAAAAVWAAASTANATHVPADRGHGRKFEW